MPAAGAVGSADPLGTHGRFASPPLPGSLLVARYALQRVARELLPEVKGIQGCCRWLQGGTVQLLHVPKFKAGAFKGLQHCGSVWSCPVCSSKITEERRRELDRGIQAHRATGGEVLLITYTLPHKRHHSLARVLAALLDARRALLGGKAAQRFESRYRVVGRVRALEVTHGENGWHPHIHELLFVEAGCDRQALEQELRARWGAKVETQELGSINKHGLDVRFSDLSVADYVAKFGRERSWTESHELTKCAAKSGKTGNRGPMGLLKDYFAGDRAAGATWREYVLHFKGQKQLVWSKGLRQRLGLGREKTDAELAAEVREDGRFMDELTKPEWRQVLGNDARAELLEVLGRGSVAELREFLAALGIMRVAGNPEPTRAVAVCRRVAKACGNCCSWRMLCRKTAVIAAPG